MSFLRRSLQKIEEKSGHRRYFSDEEKQEIYRLRRISKFKSAEIAEMYDTLPSIIDKTVYSFEVLIDNDISTDDIVSDRKRGAKLAELSEKYGLGITAIKNRLDSSGHLDHGITNSLKEKFKAELPKDSTRQIWINCILYRNLRFIDEIPMNVIARELGISVGEVIEAIDSIADHYSKKLQMERRRDIMQE